MVTKQKNRVPACKVKKQLFYTVYIKTINVKSMPAHEKVTELSLFQWSYFRKVMLKAVITEVIYQFAIVLFIQELYA